MQPPGSQKTITNRYIRHFNVIYVEPYSDASLQTIFGSVMDWMFKSQTKYQYSQGVQSCKENMVVATIQTYQEIMRRFRPTPAKSHYTYNLRDVSKVFQGIAKSDPRAIPEDRNLIKLWAHECMRVF
jgi:dynein heavy chain|mmetsp:Transcript_6477/g.8700  ORF Transcript_6477/g.8700 Transcript_6477/m.8700 type:complete len:127 (-) Transcript_6477:1556-1936(-)